MQTEEGKGPQAENSTHPHRLRQSGEHPQGRHGQCDQEQSQRPIAKIVFDELHRVGAELALNNPLDQGQQRDNAERPGGGTPGEQSLQ